MLCRLVRWLALAPGSDVMRQQTATPFIADLVERYRGPPLGAVDASVIACAERLGVDQVAAVDRRHFTVVKAKRQLAHVS